MISVKILYKEKCSWNQTFGTPHIYIYIAPLVSYILIRYVKTEWLMCEVLKNHHIRLASFFSREIYFFSWSHVRWSTLKQWTMTLVKSLSQHHLHFNLDRAIAHFPSCGVVNHPLVMEAKGIFLRAIRCTAGC